MKEFAQLISDLESTNKTNAKLTAIVNYLDRAPEKDILWFIALFTGKRPKRSVSTKLLKEWVLEITSIPYWLFVESYSSVGDLGETLSLLLPPSSSKVDQDLDTWMQEILNLKNKTDEEKKGFVIWAWNHLDYTERFIFNKLLGGSFRIGISAKMLVNALSKFSNQDPSTLMHSIVGHWEVGEVSFSDLISGKIINPNQSKPYPFCLAYPLNKPIQDLGSEEEWEIEYKWDGIRGQVIKRNEEVFIWSRGEELITTQFPELVKAVQRIKGNFVIDGEILVVKDNNIQNFNELQKRLNRKNITNKMLEELPVSFFVYDILEWEFQDIRQYKFSERREKLMFLISEIQSESMNVMLSKPLLFTDWEQLRELQSKARNYNAEGLMLKNKNSVYHSGRKKGDWWKWKIDPFSVDAVLIYAQKGSGRRSGYYTDYTFAVKDGEKLVTFAKAYSGLTDKEIMEISKFVTNHAIEKFGPVRTVKPELVFEIAFEGIGFSNRHKSGVAVRFPRILRWRKDKTVDEIDTLENIKKLIK